jgi:hypothetical protein
MQERSFGSPPVHQAWQHLPAAVNPALGAAVKAEVFAAQ